MFDNSYTFIELSRPTIYNKHYFTWNVPDEVIKSFHEGAFGKVAYYVGMHALEQEWA